MNEVKTNNYKHYH